MRHSTTFSKPVKRPLVVSAVAFSLSLGVVEAAECPAEGLRAPPGYYLMADENPLQEYVCPTVEPHTGSMNFTSKYEGSDASRDELNTEAEAEYKAAVEKVRTLEKAVIAAANDYQIDGDGVLARECVLQLLDSWGSSNAMVTDDINGTGQAVRKWALAAIANGYLRVTLPKPEAITDSDRQQRIEGWFARLSQGVQAYYSDRPLEKVNNHDYWAAWAVAATAVVSNDCAGWNWSMAKFDEAMGQISGEGYLPNELSRETRALEYLNYAMQPLATLATWAQVNQQPLYDTYHPEFQKLAGNVVDGLNDPSIIASLTGFEQVTDGLYTSWSLAWLEPWQAGEELLPGMQTLMDMYRPLKSTRLGGDLTWLYAVQSVEENPQPPGKVRVNEKEKPGGKK